MANRIEKGVLIKKNGRIWSHLPNHHWWYGKCKLSQNMYACCMNVFFSLLVPICMLSQCLVTKFLHWSSHKLVGIDTSDLIHIVHDGGGVSLSFWKLFE